MKYSLLIGAAIVPLAVIAAIPATTTTGASLGNGQSQSVSAGGIEDAWAARRGWGKSSKIDRESLRRRAPGIRPRTPTMLPFQDGVASGPSGPFNPSF